ALPEGGARELDMILLGGQGERELVASVGARLLVAEALRRDEEADLPEHLAALEPEAVVCTGGNEVLLRVRAQRDAAEEVGNGAVLAVSLALGGDADGGLLRDALDEGEADADGTATLGGAFEVALVDVWPKDTNAATPGVVDEDVRRVEAHRLVVEQRAEELRRVVTLQPA